MEGPISEHSAFRGAMNSQAELYDLQCSKDNLELMTYISPETGQRTGLSYLPPRTVDDLLRRRVMIQEWAKHSHGFLGRSPDYMNTAMMVIGETAELFAEQDPAFAENARRYAAYCRENDVSLTHAFIRPQVDRSRGFMESAAVDKASARVVEKNSDGIIVQGTLLLATQGGMTEEILVFPSPYPKGLKDDNPYTFAFALPSGTPGLKFICRDSFAGCKEFDSPLSSRFEEMDTAVVFDRVLVPWERVFLCGREELSGTFFVNSNFYNHVMHQVVSRRIVKLEFFVGVVELLIQTLNISEYQHVQEKATEVILALETMKALLIASEHDASCDQWGLMMPDGTPLFAACVYFPHIYPRITDIIQLLGASGLVSTPSEADFQSELRADLDSYLRSGATEASDRVRLFRLAWDAAMSAFGTRQTLYERFFFGDPVRLAGRLYSSYPKELYTDRVKEFLKRS